MGGNPSGFEMPCFGKVSLSNTFLSQNRMVKGVHEVYFGRGGVTMYFEGGVGFMKTVLLGHLKRFYVKVWKKHPMFLAIF